MKQFFHFNLAGSTVKQKVVLDYLRKRYGDNILIERLRSEVWELLIERYLLDALYEQRVPRSELEHEGKRLLAVLTGRLRRVEQVLEFCKSGTQKLNHQPSQDLINSLERLLSSELENKSKTESDFSELRSVPESELPLKVEEADSSSSDELSQRSVDQQEGSYWEEFDLDQFAEDAYQYRLRQTGQLPTSESHTDSNKQGK